MIGTLPSPRDVAERGALLLDFDGTLVELAPRPDAVVVPAELRVLLAKLHHRLDGAVAIVTGRTIDVLDGFLAPLVLPAAGEHGIALRHDPALPVVRMQLPGVPPSWHALAARIAEGAPGTEVERKPCGFVLHYRAAPREAETLRPLLQALVATDARFTLCQAHMALEVRPRGADKGDAVRALMATARFRGRVPLFIGDDATDEDAIAAAIALEGHGLRLHETCGTPAGLRAWLGRIIAHDDVAAA